MIYVRIMDTKNLISADIPKLIRSLPFGKAETYRLLSLKEGKRQLESLGALVALRDILKSNEISSEIARDSENGKPYFKDSSLPRFSLAHSCGICAAVIGDAEVGIDIELIRPTPKKEELANRFFSENEKRQLAGENTDENFLLIWTQKESLVKLHGASLACSLQNSPPDAKCVFSGVIDVEKNRLAVTVYSASDSEVSISVAN